MNVNKLVGYMNATYADEMGTFMPYRIEAMYHYMEHDLQMAIDADYIRFYFPCLGYGE